MMRNVQFQSGTKEKKNTVLFHAYEIIICWQFLCAENCDQIFKNNLVFGGIGKKVYILEQLKF